MVKKARLQIEIQKILHHDLGKYFKTIYNAYFFISHIELNLKKRSVHVLFSVFGSELNFRVINVIINKKKQHLKKIIYCKLKMLYIVELSFIRDNRIKHVQYIDNLLKS